MAREGATSFRGRGEIPSKAISLHFSPAFLEAKHRSKQTQPLPLPRSVSTNQLGRRNIGGQRGLKPAADIAFKVDAT